MKKVAGDLKLVLLFLFGFLLMAVPAWAVTPELVWEKTYDIADKSEASYDIVVDGSGNIYVAGSVAYDFLIVKYDPSGHELWSQVYDNGKRESASGITVDAIGNVYVTGSSSDYFCVFNSCTGGTDALTVKYDSSGNLIWAKTYNNSAFEAGTVIAVDGNGNVYVAGSTSGTSTNFLTIKYDSAGNVLWARTYDSAFREDAAKAVAVDASGNVYVTGKTDESCCASRYLTLKYNSSGSLMWATIYDDGDIYSDKYAHDITLDDAGNVYVAGNSDIPEGGRPIHLVKYDSSGNQIWARISETWLWREVKGVSLGANGNISVSGNLTSSGAYFTFTYDPSGNLVETISYGTLASNDSHSRTVIDGNGNIYTTGSRIVSYTYPIPTSYIYTQKYGVVPDSIPPVTVSNMSGTIGNNGWYVSDVAVALTASDLESGVKEIHYTVDGSETIVTGGTASFVISADGIHGVSYFAKDYAGNSEAAHPLTIKIDKTPPTVAITGVVDGAVYVPGAVPTPGYTVTDALSGVESHSAFLSGGSTEGGTVYTYHVDARDLAGNASSVSVTYTVSYGFSGFLEPISLGKPFKLGSTIPVKFRLTDTQGNYISTAYATIMVQQFSGDNPIGDTIILSAKGADTGNVFRYDAVDNLYIFNLGTKDLVQGTWQVRAALDDGSMRSVFIQLKKN